MFFTNSCYLSALKKKDCETSSAFLFASLLISIAACTPKDDPENNVKPDPKPETDPPVPEVVVSKGAYKHVVIIGMDGAGAFFKDTDTPRCDEIFRGQATTYKSRMALPPQRYAGPPFRTQYNCLPPVR